MVKLPREYPDRPIVGVGAVVVREGAVLLVKRASEPLKGQWSLPGGAVELGETLREAIKREVREETGLEIDILDVIEVFDRITRDSENRPRYHYVLVDFLCTPVAGSARAGSDVEAVAWARPEEFPHYQLSEKASAIIEKVLRSAIANAQQKVPNIDVDNLYISKVFINQGPETKRFRPAPMGRAYRILKRMSHVHIFLEERKGR